MARLVEITDSNEELPPSYIQATDAADSSPSAHHQTSSETRKGSLESDTASSTNEKSSSQDVVKYDPSAPTSTSSANLEALDHPDHDVSSDDSESKPTTTISTTDTRKHHHFGQRIKNKLTGTTHAEREEERARQAALYRKAYEAAPAVSPYYGGGYGYGGYGYGGYGYGAGLGGSLLFDAALLGGLGGFGFGGLWF